IQVQEFWTNTSALRSRFRDRSGRRLERSVNGNPDAPRLCCMEAAQRALAPARDQLRDTDADGLPEIAHTIERFHGNCDFGHAAGVVAGFQDISDHALVTTDCRFDLRAHVIAGGLLPIHAPMLFDRKDMPVALGRRCCGSWSRHGPLAWRNDETGARVSGETGVENSLRS